MQQDKQPLILWQRKEVLEKKAHRGGRLWKGNEHFLRGMWKSFTLDRAGARKNPSAPCCRKDKKGYKVSGSRNHHSERFWKMSKEFADADGGTQTCVMPTLH